MSNTIDDLDIDLLSAAIAEALAEALADLESDSGSDANADVEVDTPPRCDQTAQIAQDNKQPQACVTSEDCVTINQTSNTEIEVENEREEDDECSDCECCQ